MLQLLTLVCMEPPSSFEADKVRDEKVKVLEAITPPTPEEVAEMTVRAQYTAGVSGGEDAKGYLEEDDVPDDSQTETYAALRLEVHNWRWAGVPIVLRTGKRLARKVTEIAVQLKPVPHLAFQSQGSVGVQPNQLILTMQPNEGVSLSLGAKIPGLAHAHPPGEHGVPLRHRVHVAVAGGLRAPDPRRDARRRDAVHAQRRGRRAVVDHRPDPEGVEGRRAADVHLRGRQRRAGGGRGADRRGPALERPVSEEQEPWDDAWSERDTTPGKVEAALREMLATRHHESHAFVPARVLNLVVIADNEYRGEIENRLKRVGRFHPSRLVLCSVSEGRDTIDARVEIGTSQFAGPGHIAVGRERIVLHIGPKHLENLDTIVDPLLVPDLATVVWAPHGHAEGIDALRRLAQIVLLDSQDQPTVDGRRSTAPPTSPSNAYVVDLAWLRSTPWRERIAAAFDPPVRALAAGARSPP